MGTNKITAAVIVLVAICVASFIVVKQLVKGEQIDNPIISGVSSESVQTVDVPSTSNTEPSTAPSEATTAPESTTAPTSESSENIFSTYPVSETMPPISTTIISTSAQTTAPVSYVIPTLTTTTTTAAQTTKKNNSATTDPNITQAAKQDDGFLGYLYNETGNYYYTTNDPWQRVFGFNAAYDFGAQFVFMFFDTARIKFNYDNKDWMIETWKGQYGAVFIGAEIGVYYKPEDRTTEHYDCASDEDAIYMEMALYRDGQEILSREYTRYWWCTGFVPGKLKKYSDRSELTLKARITMPNKKMLKAFVGGLENCQEFKFVEGESYKVKNLDVYISW